MGIGEHLSGFYVALEDKWFSALDWLDAKGIPVYKYSDFLENHGIPSFPFTMGLIVLIAFLLYGLLFVGNTINPSITVNISNQFEEAVSGATITVKNSQGAQITSQTLASGSIMKLNGIQIGSMLVFYAEKEGYSPSSEEIEITKEQNSVNILLEQIMQMIDAKILLEDETSSDPVKGARVSASYRNISREAASNSSGIAVLTQLPESADIAIEIVSDAYETISNVYQFSKDETKTILLSPKSISLTGKSRLMLTIKDEQGNLVKGAEITIRDKSNDSIIYQDTAETGEYSAEIDKGTSARVIVEKSGFLRYDSQLENETRTMRLDEEPWQVVLEQGGKNFKITVTTETGTPITNATAQLFSMDSEFLDSKQTEIDGTAEFADLNSEKFFATAFADGYLPARQEIDALEASETTIKLKSADATNSSFLSIYVIDSLKAMANNTDLVFFEKIIDKELPLGVPSIKTDLSGYASIRAQIGTTVLVKATRGTEEGSGEKTIQANSLNELNIELQKSASIIELSVLDKLGNPVEGQITITTAEGELLFDGNIGADGKVLFDSQGKEKANVEVTTSDGKTFSEQVDLEGKDKVEIRIGEEATGLAPEINFLGIFDSEGNSVEGIVPGENFWLKFETTWPTGNYKGGLHVRIGNDNVKFVDSEEAGITGFDAVGASFKTGKSYQPLPEPGNETADRQNRGSLGEYNKWIELNFENPKNTTISRIKIKARESTQASQIEMHYRAWSEIGGKLYRNPEDSELGNEKYSNAKTGLYAETKTETIKIVQSLPECKKDLCASYYFLKRTGEIIEAENFKPALNETYSLEIDLSSQKATTAAINLETGIPALIYFTGYEMDSFQNVPSALDKTPLPAETNLNDANSGLSSGYLAEAPIIKETINNGNSGTKLLFADTTLPTGDTSGGYLYDTIAATPEEQLQQNPYGFNETASTDTKLSIPGIQLSSQARKIRVYFKTVDSGDAFIKSEITAPGTALQKTFDFTIPKEKQLAITISPAEILLGKDFTVSVKDKETQAAVPNATIHLNDASQKLALSIVGNGTNSRGLNGNYNVKNNFNPGKYTVQATAPDFAPAETEITIATDTILQIAKEIKISIPKGSTEAEKPTNIKNKGEQDVSNLTYEIETGSSFPEEFSISIALPATIAAKQDFQAGIKVELSLTEESKESLHGEADVTIKGTVAGQFPTKTKTKIIIDYNKKFSEDCLKFDTKELRVKLIGRAGSTAQAQAEIENTCETAVTLTPKIEAEEKDPNLGINVPQAITIEKGAKQTVPVTISNSIDRAYSMQQTFSFNIIFDSPQISKSLALKVELWNPIANLAFPSQVSLWLGGVQGQGIAADSRPLNLRNTGAEPITAFRMAVDDSAYKQYGIVAYLSPMSGEYGFLPPGGMLSPARSIVAQTSNTVPLPAPAMGGIYYTGVAMGRQMDFGMTTVSVNYPGNQCLKLSGNIAFQSKQAYGLQRQTITIRNECGEEVRIREIKPNSIGNNPLHLDPPDTTIMPNSEQKINLQILMGQQMQKTEQIRASGWLVRSQKWIESNPLAIRIEIGEKTTLSGKEPQGSKIKMKTCDSGSEKEITFPKTGDCTNGYCDAKTLSTKIIEKINDLIKKVREKSAQAHGRAEQFPCKDQVYCTFSDLGIKTESLEVYFQLDAMTPEIVKDTIKELEKKAIEIQGYAVEKRTDIVDEDALGKIAGGGFAKVIYLGTEFKGCGKYTLNIYGAVQVINNQISEDSFMILVKPEAPVIDNPEILTATPACEPKIQNIANFLPLDEGLNSSEYHKAWPGLVTYGGSSSNKSLGDTIAKQLFKADSGRSVENAQGTNNLHLVIGNNENSLVKLSIEQASGNEPRTITANIMQSAAENARIASEIALAINAVKNGSISKETCISEDESYILIKSYTAPTAPISITGPETIKVFGGETSIELIVHGDLLDKIKITTDFLEKTKTGIDYIKITDEKGNLLLKENADGTTEGANELSLSQDKPSTTPASGGTAKPAPANDKQTALLADPPAPPDAALQAAIDACKEKKQGDACTFKSGSADITGTCEPAAGKLICTPTANPTPPPVTPKPTPTPEPVAEPTTNASAKIKVIIKGSTNPDSPYVLAPQTLKSIAINAEPIDESQKNRGTKESKEIKLEACGIHVADFINKIQNMTPEIINAKPEKKIVAYATIGWKGAPDKLDLGYLNGKISAQSATAKEGQKIGIRPGESVAENPTYKAGINTKAIIGVWTGYFIPCAIISGVWGAITKMGVGAFWNIGFDCAMPAAWATKNFARELGPAGKAISDGIDDFIRHFIPIIGPWIVGKEPIQGTPGTDSLQQGAWDSYKENILGPAELGISIDSALAAVSNGGYVLNASSAQVASNQVADAVVKQIAETKFQKAISSGDVAIGRMLYGTGGLKEKLSASIKNKMLAKQLLDPKANKFVIDALEPSAREAFAEVGSDMGSLIAAASKSPDFTGDVSKAYKETKKTLVSGLINDDELATTTKALTSTKLVEQISDTDPMAYTKFEDNIADTFATNVREELARQRPDLDDIYHTDPTFAKEFDDIIDLEKAKIKTLAANSKTKIEIMTDYGKPTGRFKYSADFSGDIGFHAKQVSAKIKANPIISNILAEKVVGKKLGQEFVDKITSDIGDQILNPKKDASWWEKLKTNILQWRRAGNLGFVWNLVKNIGKGIAGGALANFAGYEGWNYYWEKFGTQPDVPTISVTSTPETQTKGRYVPGLGYIDGISEIKKGNTYRIEIIASGASGKNVFGKIGVLSDDASFGQMVKDVFQDKKSDLWESKKCSDFSEKGLEEIGQLRPKLGETAEQQFVIAYWQYDSTFAKARLGNPGDLLDDVPEEEIIALMTVQPEKLGCGMASDWYKKDEAAIRGYIDCAAGKIRANLPFEEFVKSLAGTDTRYYAAVTAAKNKWEQAKIKSS